MRIPEQQGRFLAIHYACLNGNAKMVELFLNNKVPPNVSNNKIDKATPLHFAILAKSMPIVSMLLNRKADPNAKDIVGNTPYHFV